MLSAVEQSGESECLLQPKLAIGCDRKPSLLFGIAQLRTLRHHELKELMMITCVKTVVHVDRDGHDGITLEDLHSHAENGEVEVTELVRCIVQQLHVCVGTCTKSIRYVLKHLVG